MPVEYGELSGAISSFTSNAKQMDNAMANSAKIIQNSINSIESTLTFASKEMQNSFKGMSNYDKQLLAMQQTLANAKKDIADNIKELDALIDATEDAEEKSNLIKRKNEQSRYLEGMKNLKAEDALKRKAINDLRTTAVNTISKVADQFIQIFTKSFSQAYNKLSSTYEGAYGDITSKGGFSRIEFNKLITDLSKELKQAGLANSISISNYTQQLQSIISSGMTGPLASKVAKYGVIAQESGFSFGFSNQDFLKTLSQMDAAGQDIDAFLENIIASSKSVIDEVGNAYGFANSNFDTLITSLHNIASVTNMSEKAINSSMEAMVAFNGVMGITNADTTQFYEDLTQYVTGGLGAVSKGNQLIFRELGSTLKSTFSQEGIGGALEQMISFIYDNYKAGDADSVEFIAALAESLGGNAAQIQSLLSQYTDKDAFTEAFKDALNAAQGSSYEATIKKLGEYQTAEEALANTMETNTASLVMLSQDGNIVTKQILDTLVGYVGSFSLKDAINLISNTTNTLSNLTGGKSGELLAKVGGKLIGTTRQSVVSSSANQTLMNAPGVIGKASSFLGTTGAAVGGAVLGGALTVADAVGGWKKGSIGGTKGATGAALGAITGVVGPVESGWDIAKITGKNALKYGAIGTTIGGPVGTALGAGIGAIVGATSALVEYNDKQNVLNRSLTHMTENMDKVNTALSNIQANYETSLELDDLAQKAKKGDIEAIKTLNAQYPQLATHTDNLNEYVTVLDSVVKAEKARLAKESLEQYATAVSSQKEYQAGKISAKFDTALENISNYNWKSTHGEEIDPTLTAQYNTSMETLKNYAETIMGSSLLDLISELKPSLVTNQLVLENKDALESQFDVIANLNRVGDKEFNANFGISKDEFNKSFGEKAQLIYNRYNSFADFDYSPGLTSHKFKLGIDYVPFDNFPALLHKGEKVMTATEATLQRSKGPQSTSVNSKLLDVLQLQTNTIIDILNKIYIAMPSSNLKKLAASSYVNEVKPYTLPSNAY